MDIPVLVNGATVVEPVSIDTPRIMSEGDLEWLTYLCRKRYSHAYDPDSTQAWFKNIVLKSPVMFYPIRTRDAFVITMLSIVPWLPNDVDANVIFICADTDAMWQSFKLLRCSIEWAQRRRATLWRLSSDTDAELRAIAKRLGCTEIEPRFIRRFVRSI